MSFVLDALKVSEQRRSRFSRRIYAHPPRPRRRARGRGWLAALGALGAVALVALAWQLTAPGQIPGSAPGASGVRTASPPQELAAGNPGTLAAPAAGDGAVLAPSEAAAAAAGIEAGPESVEPETPSPGVRDGSPGQKSEPEPETASRALTAPPPDWPALSLQMLFFSEEESRSFVQVNGKTYRQGERLPAGPEVLRISGEGVTLAYRGQQALLGMER